MAKRNTANTIKTLRFTPSPEDLAEMLNLIGRPEYKEIANQLRAELLKRIIASGKPEVTITPIHYYA